MTFGDAVRTCLAKYVTFSGRAIRPEYWYFVLFSIGLSLIVQISSRFVEQISAPVAIGAPIVLSLLLFLPSLAVSIRRLHDIGRSGWWVLIALLPVIGWILLIYWHCKPGVAANSYRPVPEGGAAAP